MKRRDSIVVGTCCCMTIAAVIAVDWMRMTGGAFYGDGSPDRLPWVTRLLFDLPRWLIPALFVLTPVAVPWALGRSRPEMIYAKALWRTCAVAVVCTLVFTVLALVLPLWLPVRVVNF